MGKNKIQGLISDIKNKETENRNADHAALEKIEEALAGGEYKLAFRLFQRDIIGIMCRESILDVCSPYYCRNGRIKEDKVVAELIGVFQYYTASNDGIRSFLPHGKSFRCGQRTATFMEAVKKFAGLLAESSGANPWKVYLDCINNDYYDLEKYLDQAAAYGFPHNRHSRKVTGKVLAPYAEKHYGNMDTGEFIEFYQAIDRVYTTYGFPFACTYAGWFFEGYDGLYQKVFDEGVWGLWAFWESQTPSDWLKKQIEPYGMQPSYNNLIEALQDPVYEPLLCRIFPFRLTENTLRAGCSMDADEWEDFILKLAKTLHFAECRNGRKNVPEDVLKRAVNAMEDTLKTIRYYMDTEKTCSN